METDVAATLWVLLLAATVKGGVLRDRRQADDDDLPCRTFNFQGILHLDCSNQGLSQLPDDLDSNALVINLSNNIFRHVPAQLETFTQMQTLDLSGNRLYRPLPSYLQNKISLRSLNLSNNDFYTWTSNGRYNNLRNLDLSRNKITNIEETAFNEMTYLYYLDLSENRIYELPTKIFSSPNLETVILSRNEFAEIPSIQTSYLKYVYLSSCKISMLSADALAGMTSLFLIDLSMNQLEYIPDNLASNTLQELNLAYNAISTLTDQTFSSLPHLAVLDLRGNDFTTVWSTSHFSSNLFLREVYVKGNRWSCEGFSLDLLVTYEFFTRDPPKVADRASLICYSPSNVTQLSWQQAYIQTWHPGDYVAESFTIVAAMIGLIIGVTITSCICRGLMSTTRPETPRLQTTETTNHNGLIPQPRIESVIMRVPLRDEDLPPTYDEALLMPRLNASFHSLPDFVDEEEDDTLRRSRRSRSIGDLTESRPRAGDRRSRRTVEIHIS